MAFREQQIYDFDSLELAGQHNRRNILSILSVFKDRILTDGIFEYLVGSHVVAGWPVVLPTLSLR